MISPRSSHEGLQQPTIKMQSVNQTSPDRLQPEGVQRVVIVGLGQYGVQLANHVLGQLQRQYGDLDIFTGLGICDADSPQAQVDHLWRTITVSFAGDGNKSTFQDIVQPYVQQVIHQVSQVNHLTQLAQQGIRLQRPDEIYGLILADLSLPNTTLPWLIDLLQIKVSQYLAGGIALTGVLLDLPPEADVDPANTDTDKPDRIAAKQPANRLPDIHFDRGCFLVSTMNEMGLSMQSPDQVLDRTAMFLVQLLTTSFATLILDQPWQTPWMSFGLSKAIWPYQHLAQYLGQRWASRTIRYLLGPPAFPEYKADRQARALLSETRLAPPLLLETLAPHIPPLPNNFDALVPSHPWPWKLNIIKTKFDQVIEDWQSAWQMAQPNLSQVCQTAETRWNRTVETWFQQRLAQPQPGLLTEQAHYLQAITTLLDEVKAGLTVRLEEAEAALAQVEEAWVAQEKKLHHLIQHLPQTPLAMVLRWGWQPLAWLHFWLQCQQAHALARQNTATIRQWMLAQQTAWVYQALKPLYEQLWQTWQAHLVAWQVGMASLEARHQACLDSLHQQSIADILSQSEGPWSSDWVEAHYQSQTLSLTELWSAICQTFNLNEAANDEAWETLLDQAQHYAASQLTKSFQYPIDVALMTHLPDEAIRQTWLTAFLNRSTPFWQYDETTMTEHCRSASRLAQWLTLPNGSDNALSDDVAKALTAINLLPGADDSEMTAISVRWGVSRKA